MLDATQKSAGAYFTICNHVLANCRYVESPNCDDRVNADDISLLVIHCISLPPGQFEGNDVERLFTNCLDCSSHRSYKSLTGVCVSAHCFIRRDGAVIQFVPFNKRAWHAGKSQYRDRASCNDFSIGIELEGTVCETFTDEQYDALAALSAAILHTYPQMSASNIVGHSDIAPGRKTDPGEGFCWHSYRHRLERLLDLEEGKAS